MHAARTLMIVALLPLFAGCQMLAQKPSNPNAGLTRMQGELSRTDGTLSFQPCDDQRRYVLRDRGNTGIAQEAAGLSRAGPLFADLRGSFTASKAEGGSGELELQQFYRLERGNGSCADPDFRRQTVLASGNAPGWSLKASGKGMALARENQPTLVFPYLEEQLGDGRFSLSTEANGLHVELWVAPQRCVDSISGNVSHMSAELRINGQVQRGCASFGGGRND